MVKSDDESRLQNWGPTLREIWSPVLPRLSRKKPGKVPDWPPDLFALTALALRQDSLYVRVLSDRWPGPEFTGEGEESWVSFCGKTARAWARALTQKSSNPPKFVSDRWRWLTQNLDRPFQVIHSERGPEIGLVLMELLSIADEACGYLVARYGIDASDMSLLRPLLLTRLLLKKHRSSSICDEIHPSRLRVLPKFRTPQEGLTIRSLSLYVGLIEGNEICPHYEQAPTREDPVFNVLVIPWPLVLKPTDFLESAAVPGEMQNMASTFGYFTVGAARHFESGAVVERVLALIDEARDDVGRIAAVILPELALPELVGRELATALNKHDIALIAGIGSPAIPGKFHGRNRVLIAIKDTEKVVQEKQHRWKLDGGQIRQYSLGGQLDPGRSWWEHINLGSRNISFTRIRSWLSTCVLICEDLARPDPAGDVIRAVGPGLTVALLMDGPQTKGRWGARHATTLAEDPGCSVLTLTSLGMSKLSRPQAGQVDRSRVIALWKEEDHDFVEIELPAERDAAVLSLTLKKCIDWAADGRSRLTAVPSLSGVRYFRMPSVIAGEEVSSKQVTDGRE